jgi:hypothetical protein
MQILHQRAECAVSSTIIAPNALKNVVQKVSSVLSSSFTSVNNKSQAEQACVQGITIELEPFRSIWCELPSRLQELMKTIEHLFHTLQIVRSGTFTFFFDLSSYIIANSTVGMSSTSKIVARVKGERVSS